MRINQIWRSYVFEKRITGFTLYIISALTCLVTLHSEPHTCWKKVTVITLNGYSRHFMFLTLHCYVLVLHTTTFTLRVPFLGWSLFFNLSLFCQYVLCVCYYNFYFSGYQEIKVNWFYIKLLLLCIVSYKLNDRSLLIDSHMKITTAVISEKHSTKKIYFFMTLMWDHSSISVLPHNGYYREEIEHNITIVNWTSTRLFNTNQFTLLFFGFKNVWQSYM